MGECGEGVSFRGSSCDWPPDWYQLSLLIQPMEDDYIPENTHVFTEPAASLRSALIYFTFFALSIRSLFEPVKPGCYDNLIERRVLGQWAVSGK